MNWSCVGAKYSVVVTSLIDESCVEDDQFIVRYRNGFCTDCCHKQTVNGSCNLTELKKFDVEFQFELEFENSLFTVKYFRIFDSES